MGKYINGFFRRIITDFKQKELLPVKVLFFVHMSTILVLYPYLTIHMRELGINVEETAIMSAVTPVVGILMPPMAGLIADKIGNFKVMLALFSVFSGLSALLLLLIPVGRVTITYADNHVLGVSCKNNNPLEWTSYNEYPCDRITNQSVEIDVSMESCGILCQAYLNDQDTEAIFRSKYYDIQMHNVKENKSTSFRYTLTKQDYYVPINLEEVLNHQKIAGNGKYKSSIRRLSKNTYYFPTPTLFNFSCQLGAAEIGEYNNTKITDQAFEIPNEVYNCMLVDINTQRFPKTFKVGIGLQNQDEEDIVEARRRYTTQYLKDGQNHKHNVTCLNNQNKNHISVNVLLQETNSTTVYKNLDLGSCARRCIATSKRTNFCKNIKTTIDLDIDLTFWSYLAVRVFIGIIGGTAYTMFEGAVIAILREYKADYGLQRMYASLGGMISSPLAGLLIDYASRGKGYTDFRPIFFLYAGLKATSAVLMLFINLEFKQPATSIVADVMSLMNVELVSLFVAVFLLGSAWGYIESFLFWLLQDLGGTKSLMGLTITVGGILGIPLLAMSGPIIKKFGHANIIFIGFLTYAVRLFGYSIIYNPWLSLIFEAMECLTHSLCFTAAVTYAARLSSITTDTTIQGILGGLFYGVGKSAGSLVGGYLIKYVGMRGTFQIFAAVTGITAFLYLAFYHIYMKERSALKNDSKENEMKKVGADADDIKDKDVAKPMPFEDTLTNLAYEDNEFDPTKLNDTVEKSDTNKKEIA